MNTKLSDVIVNRRTIHNFASDRCPDQSTIQSALEIARWAPNHYLTEPWHVYFIGPETKESICQLNADIVRTKNGEQAAEKKLTRWRCNPGWMLLTCDKSDDALRQQEDYASCCCFIQNLSLVLWEKEVGMKWSTGDVIRDSGMYELCNIDETTEIIVGILWYGYANAVPTMKRKSLAEFTKYLV